MRLIFISSFNISYIMPITNQNIREKFSQRVSQGVLVILVGLTLVSYIFSLNAFISPTRELRWDGAITYLSDTTFSPGDPVLVEGRLIEGENYFSIGYYYYSFSPEDIRWILIVIGPNNTPIHIENNVVPNANGIIDTGQINFDLPSNAAAGQYRIRMMVWSDVLPLGETRTREIQEITFEVV